MSSLTRIVAWSQQLACEVLLPGDLAVDLTAGKGRDTCVLAKAVGPQGQVVAFDLQREAIGQAAEFLQEHGQFVRHCSADRLLPEQPGVYLVHGCHSAIDKVVQRPVRAVMANLGYLPGGDQSLVTQPETTLDAMRQSTALLKVGGRLAVTVYPGHPGGAEEAVAVQEFFAGLPVDCWQVLAMQVLNSRCAPCLLVAERTS